MGMISTERRGNVCVVWLDRNITNAINMRCAEELERDDPATEQ